MNTTENIEKIRAARKNIRQRNQNAFKTKVVNVNTDRTLFAGQKQPSLNKQTSLKTPKPQNPIRSIFNLIVILKWLYLGEKGHTLIR